MIAPIYYRVNGEIIFNEMLAKYREFTTGKPAEFICHDDEYDKLDWTQEPTETLDELMTQHAYRLRAKYDRLILFWSGGTDSHTIYNIFVRNNIHIDEIVCSYDELEFEDFYAKSYVDWLIANHPDPLTKITPKLRFELDRKALTVDNEDWILQNRPTLFKIGLSYLDPLMEKHFYEQYPNERWAIIGGYHPPVVTKRNNRWYYTQVGRYLACVMGFQNAECFYLEPRINIKQSHMAKRFFKNLENKAGRSVTAKELHQTSAGYTLMSKAIGRHQELFPGYSYRQKCETHRFERSEFELDSYNKIVKPNGEPGLIAGLEKDHPTAHTYIRGIYNLLLEKDFCEFLGQKTQVDTNLTCPPKITNNIFVTSAFIHSKARDLGV